MPQISLPCTIQKKLDKDFVLFEGRSNGYRKECGVKCLKCNKNQIKIPKYLIKEITFCYYCDSFISQNEDIVQDFLEENKIKFLPHFNIKSNWGISP